MDRKNNIIVTTGDITIAAEISSGYTEERLIGASNKGIYKRALKDLDAAGEIKLEIKDGTVTVTLPDAEVSMCSELSQCRCSCPSKVICRHIISAAAVLMTLSSSEEKNERISGAAVSPAEHTVPDAAPKDKAEKPVPDETYLKEVMNITSGILEKGMISCGTNDAEVLTRLSLSAPTVHREIGKMCRSLAEDIQLCLDRSGGFSPITAAARLCRMYNMAEISMTEEGKGLLFSGSSYEHEGNGSFICLGTYPHRSRSGFAGVTAVLFEKNTGQYFTYNTGMSDIYSKTENAGSLASLTKQYKAHSHWQNEVSLEMINGHELTLFGFRADSSRRISSSKQTVCNILSPIDFGNIPEEACRVPVEEYDYFFPSKAAAFSCVKTDMIKDVRLDTGSQTICYTIVSGDERVLCRMPWTDQAANSAAYIQAIEGRELSHTYMLVRYFGNTAQAISRIDLGGVHSFWFKGK